jgi:hypothetical protein
VILRSIIDDAPNDTEPRFLLSTLYELKRKPRTARDAYRAVLAIEPNHPLARLGLRKLGGE